MEATEAREAAFTRARSNELLGEVIFEIGLTKWKGEDTIKTEEEEEESASKISIFTWIVDKIF